MEISLSRFLRTFLDFEPGKRAARAGQVHEIDPGSLLSSQKCGAVT